MDTLDLSGYLVNHIAIEATLKAFDLERDVRFLESLSTFGYNYRIIEKMYPYPQYISIYRAIMARGLPGMEDVAAGRELGRRLYNAYAQTLIGRIVAVALNLAPLERVIALTMRAFDQNVDFGTRSYAAISPTHYTCRFRDDPAAHYPIVYESIAGLFESVCEKHGATNATVTATTVGVLGYDLDIRWTAKN